jgi:hypothetical protein
LDLDPFPAGREFIVRRRILMKALITGSGSAKEAEQQLRTLIAKFTPKEQTLIRALRRALRKRFPTALELVYDYSSSLVIAYAPTERGSDALVAIAARADGVRLFFNNSGTPLPDPTKILRGSGKEARFIPLESVALLARPEVRSLIAAAVAQAKIPLPETGGGTLIIKSSRAKKR